MVPLIGYVDRFSARTGERIAVKVSSRLAEPYRADLVRIIHGDANPAGHRRKFEEVAATFAETYPSRFQPAYSGSCGMPAGRRLFRAASHSPGYAPPRRLAVARRLPSQQ